MRIVTATLIKLRTDDGQVENVGPVGKTYLVDLESVGEARPAFVGFPEIRPAARVCILAVCPDCRSHYVGKLPLELLRIEADA